MLGVLVLLVELVSAQALPVWSEADRARLKKGELIAGADILVDDPDTMPLPRVAPDPDVPPVEPVEPVAPEPDYDPKLIPQEHLPEYFQSNPEGYLIDPQRLLSKQEAMDREGFLEYHANDSKVDIKLYLFDAMQEIPPPYTLQKLVQERYVGGDLTAVVFCFLGDPSRNILAFGGEGASGVASSDVRKMLESAQVKALEKSDPIAQIEAFVVQLSIRLYWLEKDMLEKEVANAIGNAGQMPSEGAAGVVEAGAKGANRESTVGGAMAEAKPYLLYAVVGGGGVVLCLGGLVMTVLLWQKHRKYQFPVLDISRRLGANYAAGVGAVLAFHNKLGSPSSQRDQVPDYLTRM